jgi:hypothetical protein
MAAATASASNPTSSADGSARDGLSLLDQAMALAAEQGATGSIDTPEGPLDLRQLFMISLPTTIFGGSSEVQRNILAKHWLDLPTG